MNLLHTEDVFFFFVFFGRVFNVLSSLLFVLFMKSHPIAILRRFTLCSSNAKKTETRKDYFYARPVGRSGGIVRQNALPGHIHARRGGSENQPAGVSRPGQSQTLDFQD